MATPTPTTTLFSDHRALVSRAVAAQFAESRAAFDRMSAEAIAAVLARVAKGR